MHRASGAVIEPARQNLGRTLHRRLRPLIGSEGIEQCPPVEIEQTAGGEAHAQAISGLMSVHGRDEGRPLRLGLEIATAAATILASQGAIAAALAARRGSPVARVHTSVLAGALSFLHHHLALATCGNDLPFSQPAAGEGPPFRTRDGHLIEIEALLGADWTRFWTALGGSDEIASEAWLPFVFRFLAGRCALPHELHDVIARHDAKEVLAAAAEAGLAACRVRSCAELLAGGPLPGDRATIAPMGAALARGGEKPRGSSDSPGPLSGVRVIEVTSRLQGPLAALLLRQLGADVIKVEPPGGDFGRRSLPRAGNVGAAYLAYNRSKQRIEVDYKTSAGLAQLIELASSADVFMHNFPPGRAEALGIDAAALARVNPALIYAHASGWGSTADAPCAIASDYLVQAHAALGDGLYPAGEPGRPSRLTLVDAVGGLLACEGVLAALYRRARSGRGQRVHSTLFSAAMALQRDNVAALRLGRERTRVSGRLSWSRLDQPLAAADHFLFLGPLSPRTRRLASAVCGLPHGATEDQIAARVRARPVSSWLSDFADAGVPACRVCTDLQALPGAASVSPWLDRVGDACWAPGAPWRFSV